MNKNNNLKNNKNIQQSTQGLIKQQYIPNTFSERKPKESVVKTT